MVYSYVGVCWYLYPHILYGLTFKIEGVVGGKSGKWHKFVKNCGNCVATSGCGNVNREGVAMVFVCLSV